MANFPTPIVDYTDRDFDSLRARIYSIIEAVFPTWTNRNVANFGNILVESFCHIGDVLGFYLDNHARESRIVTAEQRRSLINLAKLLNYVPSGAGAATTDVILSLSEVPTNDVIIPAGTIVRTLAVTGPVSFQLLAAATIPAATNPAQVVATVEHSESFTEGFTSTGLANQELSLSNTPYLDESLLLSATNGTYTKVDNFLSSTAADLHYTVVVDQNDRATVRFGNGANGQLPTGSITASYKIGGGASGNLEPGSLARVVGSFTDVLSNAVTVSVSQPNDASGGTARESVAEIRANAPESLRALNRTVSREDYEINAKRVAGVARALMLTSNEYDVIQENQGSLFVVPTGGGTASQTLLDAVLEMVTVTYPNTLTFLVNVQTASYLTVDVQATVFPTKGTNLATLDATIRANLTSFFAISNTDGSANEAIDFGLNYKNTDSDLTGEIPLSDVFNVVRDTSGVRKVSDELGGFVLNDEHKDLTIGVQQFPQLGTVTLVNGETGLALV